MKTAQDWHLIPKSWFQVNRFTGHMIENIFSPNMINHTMFKNAINFSQFMCIDAFNVLKAI